MESTSTLDIPISARLDRVIEVFDAELRSDLPFVNRLIEQVRRYRGKLLRPRLLLMAAEAAGRITDDHITLAAVVEMVHMATLVHDDVLDDADTRRRSVTIGRLVGNEGAVLLGDALISHAYHLCSGLDTTEASRRIAAVTNTVCEGELMQIENRGRFDLCEADYLEIIRRKTASLTSVCCELGAAFSGADAAVVDRLSAYGRDLGIAFQIVDDLLDLTATEGETGKTTGRDADLGNLTLPLIRYLKGTTPRRRAELLGILSNGHPQKTDLVRALIADSDCIEAAMVTAESYTRSAIDHLSILRDGDAKAALVASAEFVVARRE